MSKRPAARSQRKEWKPPEPESTRATVTVTAEKPKTMARPKVADVTVRVIPPHCPRVGCGSTERTGLEGFKTRDINGVIDGFAYNCLTWAYTSCRKCGQRYRVICPQNK